MRGTLLRLHARPRRIHRGRGGRENVRIREPCSHRTFEDLPRDTPLFLARAGRDESPGLNAALDAFLARAVRDNRPVTFVNHATGPHAFDVMDDSPATRDVIRQILAFLKSHLSDGDGS